MRIKEEMKGEGRTHSDPPNEQLGVDVLAVVYK
jgi:hypothetical protein